MKFEMFHNPIGALLGKAVYKDEDKGKDLSGMYIS